MYPKGLQCGHEQFSTTFKMKKIEIITDEHRHHVYIGNTDFWLNTKELLELYFKLGDVKL